MARAARRRGVTLMELLVVIVIMALLMSIGVGVWLKFLSSSNAQESYGRLAAMVRRARVFALEESSGSKLILDVKGRSFHAEGLRLLGMWNLEGSNDPRRPGVEVGFAGRELVVAGGIREDAASKAPVLGYRGAGVAFAGSGALVMADEAFTFPTGGELSCYLRTELDSAAANRRQNIFTRGNELQLFINITGELEARSGSARLATGYRPPLGRWIRVSFFFSPEELVIAVDGVVRGRASPGDLPTRKEEHLPIILGEDPSAGFALVGTVDEPAIRRIVREETYRLPADVELDSPVGEVHFDAAGMLDRRYHSGPVRIGIKSREDSAPGGFVTRWITISMDGEIREE